MKRRIRTYSGTKNQAISEREIKNRAVARRAAAEGMVLLKNEGVLPLKRGSQIALFGCGAGRTIKGGTGSGDVNERESVSIYQGLLNAGMEITSSSWIEDYEARYREAREVWKNTILEEGGKVSVLEFFMVYASHVYQIPDGRPLVDRDFGEADTAVYVVSRIAGEGADRRGESGDYYLTDKEKEDLHKIGEKCRNVIVVLNAGGAVDLKGIEEATHVEALISIVQPGMEGGNALADVLTGVVTPSGKLTDTWAVDYEDFPNAKTFSFKNGDVVSEKYEEGIYVGYRYFDSFQIEPAYPFGYGLSYTEFKIQAERVWINQVSEESVEGRDANRSGAYVDSGVCVEVNVENTGDTFAGKEVVQVYATCPQEGLPKEYQRLCAFAKTELLQPGESQKLVLTFPAKALASFDEKRGAWVVENGVYGIWVGNSSRNVELARVLKVEEDAVLEEVAHICPLKEELNEIVPPQAERMEAQRCWHEEAKKLGILPLKFAPVYRGESSGMTAENRKRMNIMPTAEEEERARRLEEVAKRAEKVAEKLSDEELTAMVIGEANKGQDIALGSAGIMVPGSAGETSSALTEKWDIPGITMADGPAGVRLIRKYAVDRENGEIYGAGFLDGLEGGYLAPEQTYENVDTYYQYSTAFPVGTLLAQTWDTELLEEAGRAVAEEMQEFGVAWWLAPGMNIHRNPLCGRNFEYYSEDPLVSGLMAAAITRGVQSLEGVGTTIKHFACNNQEDNRMGSNTIISERALREIYLRGFEIAVKRAQPMAIMTSYNRINGVHAANCSDLCTVAAREEWGFQGIIMTDWTTTSELGGSLAWKCIQSGNDLIMPGFLEDAQNIRQALEQGELSRDELRACVRRLLRIIFQTLGYEDCGRYGEQFGI